MFNNYLYIIIKIMMHLLILYIFIFIVILIILYNKYFYEQRNDEYCHELENVIKLPEEASHKFSFYYSYNPIVLCSMFSTYSNNFDYLKHLIKNGANIDERTKDYFYDNATALMIVSHNSYFCKRFSNLETLRYLIDNGANINARDGRNGTALLWSCKGDEKYKKHEITKLLIKNGADINAQGYKGRTALIESCISWNNNVETIKFLIRKKCNINIKDEHGYTALMHICKNFVSADLLLFMLEYGASIYSSNKNNVLKIIKKKYKKSYIYDLVFNFEIIKGDKNIKTDINFIYC